MLTKDQSIIDMAYDVRWSIKDPELYLFQLESPRHGQRSRGKRDARGGMPIST